MVSKIEQQVMAGVGVIYIARMLTSRFALECYALLLSLAGTAYFVSLPNVATNLLQVASGGLPSIGTFLLSAVVGTKLVVQIALLIGAAAAAFMAFDIVRQTPKRQFVA